MESIRYLELPDIEDGQGNYMKQNTFQVIESEQYVEFRPDAEKNALVFANKKVTAMFACQHFRYKVMPLTVAKGYAEVDMNQVDIEIGLAFSTRTLDDGHIVPYVESVDVQVEINRNDIKIHIMGNLLTDMAALFEVFFKGTVANIIEKAVYVALDSEVPKVTNAMIGALDGTIRVPMVPNWKVDWQTPEAFVVNNEWIGAGFKGLFFDSRIGEEEPSVSVPEMQLKDSEHPEKFQNWISSYTVNSLLESVTEVKELKDWVRSDETEGGITCGEINAIVPGIAAYYGADALVDIFIQF
jgi:hypothetical protein